MSKVFVVQQPVRRVSQEDIDRGYYTDKSLGKFVPRFDLSPASAYGDIELLLDSGVIMGIAAAPVIRTFKEKLQGYCSDDFILPTGDPVAMGLAIAIAANYNGGLVNILRWDRRERRYIKIKAEI